MPRDQPCQPGVAMGQLIGGHDHRLGRRLQHLDKQVRPPRRQLREPVALDVVEVVLGEQLQPPLMPSRAGANQQQRRHRLGAGRGGVHDHLAHLLCRQRWGEFLDQRRQPAPPTRDPFRPEPIRGEQPANLGPQPGSELQLGGVAPARVTAACPANSSAIARWLSSSKPWATVAYRFSAPMVFPWGASGSDSIDNTPWSRASCGYWPQRVSAVIASTFAGVPSRSTSRHGPSPLAYCSSSSCSASWLAAAGVVGPLSPTTVTLQLAAAVIVRVASAVTLWRTSVGCSALSKSSASSFRLSEISDHDTAGSVTGGLPTGRTRPFIVVRRGRWTVGPPPRQARDSPVSHIPPRQPAGTDPGPQQHTLDSGAAGPASGLPRSELRPSDRHRKLPVRRPPPVG